MEQWTVTHKPCPNCGRMTAAYANQRGDIRMKCLHCKTVSYSKMKPSKRRTIIIDPIRDNIPIE